MIPVACAAPYISSCRSAHKPDASSERRHLSLLAESPHLCSFAKCFSHLSSLAALVFHSLTACLSVDIYMHGPKCMWKVRKTFIDPVSDNPSKSKVVKRTMLYCIYWFPVVGKRKEWLLFMPNFAAGALNRIMYFIALKTQSTHCCEKCLFELGDDQVKGFLSRSYLP